jgi:RNA-directed DNA polymerase
MSEGALVNAGAVEWPHPDSAYFAARRMQAKLHRRAAENPGRRFGDLFNLVYDPAFLVARGNAWPTARAPGPRASAGPLRP